MVYNCVGMWSLEYKWKERDTLYTSGFGNLRLSKLFSCGFLLIYSIVSNYIVMTHWWHTEGKRDDLGVPFRQPTLSIHNNHRVQNHTPNQTRPQTSYISSLNTFQMGRKASQMATWKPWKDKPWHSTRKDDQRMLKHFTLVCVITYTNGTLGDAPIHLHTFVPIWNERWPYRTNFLGLTLVHPKGTVGINGFDWFFWNFKKRGQKGNPAVPHGNLLARTWGDEDRSRGPPNRRKGPISPKMGRKKPKRDQKGTYSMAQPREWPGTWGWWGLVRRHLGTSPVIWQKIFSRVRLRLCNLA